MTLMTPIQPAPGDPGRLTGVHAWLRDAETEAVVRRVAGHMMLPGFEVQRGTIVEAERRLRSERSPAVLIVDISGIDRVLDAVQALSDVCEPQLQVVVVGEANDVGLFRRLLAMGVADYLFKPLTADMLEAVILRLSGNEAHGSNARLGKLVAVCGGRGGVGTSSIAANLASYLSAQASRRVVLVDLDTAGGTQALILGAAPNSGLAEALAVPGRIDDLFLERATISLSPRLDLMASEMASGQHTGVDPAAVVTAEAAEALLGRLQQIYHYVVMDVPLGRRAQMAELLHAAQVQMVACDATIPGARDGGRALRAADARGVRTIAVHAMAGRPGDLGSQDFTAALGRAPDCSMPFLPQAFGQAQNLGRPAWTEDNRVAAATSLLARELSGQSVAMTPAPAWKRWIGLAS